MYTSTELHKIVATNDIEKIATFLKITPQETLYRQCHTVDDLGNIPLNLSMFNRDRETTAFLSRIMKNPPVKPLKEQLNFNEVIQDTGLAHKNCLYQGMQDAVLAVNSVRKKMVYSSTHPNCPHSVEDECNILSKTAVFRSQTESYLKGFLSLPGGHSKIIQNKDYFAVIYKPSEEICQELLDIQSAPIENTGYGNCTWMSFNTLNYFNAIQAHKPAKDRISAEVFWSKYGDHMFLIAGRDPRTDPKKPETWNSDLILIDSWAGEVSLIKTPDELSQKLRLLHHVGADFRNMVTFYNPAYHDLNLSFWNFHPHHFHMFYLPKESANSEADWLKFLEFCEGKEANDILQHDVWKNDLTGFSKQGATLFHYPTDQNLSLQEQEDAFLNLFFSLDFIKSAKKNAIHFKTSAYPGMFAPLENLSSECDFSLLIDPRFFMAIAAVATTLILTTLPSAALIIGAALIIFLALLLVTCPSEEKAPIHKAQEAFGFAVN